MTSSQHRGDWLWLLLLFGPGRQTEGRPLVFVLPGEPPGEDPAVPRPQRDVAVVVLSAALHPALGQDVRVLRSPGQLGSLAVMDLFVELAEKIKKSSLLHSKSFLEQIKLIKLRNTFLVVNLELL